MPEAAQLFFSAVIGALAGAFAAAYKSRKELESLYDIELRRRRIDAYVHSGNCSSRSRAGRRRGP